MLDEFFKIVGGDVKSNLFWASIGAFIGFLMPKIFGLLSNPSISWYEKYRTSKTIQNLKVTEEELQVEVLSTANEPYKPDSIDVSPSGKSFYIAFPKERIDELEHVYKAENKSFQEFFDIHDDTSFSEGSDFKEISKECEITELPELIEEARQSVADHFINAKNGAYFNKGKYGVWDIKFTQRYGKKEERHLKISLYETDYFTHKVMRQVYKKVHNKYIFPSDVDVEYLHKYRAFLTSFGVNALVMLNDKKRGNIIILSERSILASETNQTNTYHITMNEGLNQDDIDNYEGKIRISNCLERGLWEELGLDNDIYAQKMTSEFHDLFLVRNVFEVGISASVFIDKMNFSELHSRAQIAKDKKLEIGKLVPINLKKNEIEKFLLKNNFIPYSRYIISRICARKKIFLNEENIIKR